MNRLFKRIAIILGLGGLVYLLPCTSISFFLDHTKCQTETESLIKTKWKQMGGFENIRLIRLGRDTGIWPWHRSIITTDLSP
jgi:hypothetical protein